MASKDQKLQARLPRGLADRTAADIRATERMIATIKSVYERYGFEPIETPLIEYTDALGKFLPDQDRPNEGVFSFQDDDEQWLSLRYDLTAPLARYVAENFEKLPKPFRSYRQGWVFRNEKPGPGRFRQFMQFDADTVGTPGVAADAEMAMMMADVMEALGIARGDYVIRVNNRKVLDGVLEGIGVVDAGQKLAVLRAIDKLDKFGAEDVRQLLGAGRWDGGKIGEGDYTKGAGLNEKQISCLNPLLQYVHGSGARATHDLFAPEFEITKLSPKIEELSARARKAVEKVGAANAIALGFVEAVFSNARTQYDATIAGYEGYAELAEIAAMVHAAGYGPDRIRIDPSVVRGLEYYTGPVYEAELLAEIPNEDGQIVRFGSVGGGGRYDGLVSRFRGEPVPATGFSIGVSRLMTALKNLGKLQAAETPGPVVVLVMDRDTESLGRYQKMVGELRTAGIRAEMYLGGSGMKPQMKYADRRGAPCVVIQGGDERAKGVVQVKDLVEGARMAETITDNAEWREGRPAQVEVPESELVATVRGIIAAQAAERGGR